MVTFGLRLTCSDHFLTVLALLPLEQGGRLAAHPSFELYHGIEHRLAVRVKSLTGLFLLAFCNLCFNSGGPCR